tara:strand:- start:642 stop:827 length:186 start_codon:yes stop_codon:yes gene_type:complete
MNKILIGIIAGLFLVGCSSIDNPRVSFGKKCLVKKDDVAFSYVWFYDKDTGLMATKEQCED